MFFFSVKIERPDAASFQERKQKLEKISIGLNVAKKEIDRLSDQEQAYVKDKFKDDVLAAQARVQQVRISLIKKGVINIEKK